MLSAYCGHLDVVKAIVENLHDVDFLDEPGNKSWAVAFGNQIYRPFFSFSW
jgi:hypothetical protein